MTETDHPLQEPLWQLEWAIQFATEHAEHVDAEAAKAWERVAELDRQLDETLKRLAGNVVDGDNDE